jgi:rod shape-determining protein MreC
VQSNRSGVRTIAVGTGDLTRLVLPFVTGESDLKQGDLLLSTGMGGVFPPGYPVAKITRVERNAKATFAIVEARPTAALDRDREVLLVWFKPPAPEPPPAAAPAPAATASAPAPTASAPAAAASTPRPRPAAATPQPSTATSPPSAAPGTTAAQANAVDAAVATPAPGGNQ